MKTNEFDNIVNNILEEETRKLIKEQIEETNNLIDSVKNFQSLSGLLDKITGIENTGTNGIVININGVTPEELVDCCGGESLGNSQTKLMQALHHDLEDNGNYEIDIDVEGDVSSLNLMIKITPDNDELSTETDMKEVTDNGELTNTFGQAMYEEDKTEKNMKKTITLNQNEMADLLGNIIKEAVESPNIPTANGIPGLDVTNKAITDSGKENISALKAVEKKIKDYLAGILGTDKPEGLNPEGQGEEKVAVQASETQEEEIEMNRGRNPADLTYDYEPSKEFSKRAKLALIGDEIMGNSHKYANVVNPDSKVGENIAKTAEKRKEIRKDEPIYDKEAVPVKNDAKKDVRPAVDDATGKNIKRIKQLSNYKEKTQ